MERKTHVNASTTLEDRKYIQSSSKSTRLLSDELNVSEVTIRKWRKRNFVEDKSHVAKKLNTTLSHDEESVVVFFRIFFCLSIDDLLSVTKVFVNDRVSRSALGRLIKRKNLKKEKKIVYIKNLKINSFYSQFENCGAVKILVLPFDKYLENIEGLLIFYDIGKKTLALYALKLESPENGCSAKSRLDNITTAICDYCRHNDSHLLLVSESSSMQNELVSVCEAYCRGAEADSGVYCEKELDCEFISTIGGLVESLLFIRAKQNGLKITQAIRDVQNTYNVINC